MTRWGRRRDAKPQTVCRYGKASQQSIRPYIITPKRVLPTPTQTQSSSRNQHKPTNKQKTQIIAEKIARFTKRASQFDKENLYGGLGDRLGSNLQKFVEGMKKIVNHFKENKKEEPKKENTDVKDDIKKEVRKNPGFFVV